MSEALRNRDSDRVRSSYKSHNLYKDWTTDKNGDRAAKFTTNPKADLISTYYQNKSSQTLYCLSFDLDIDRATNKSLIDENGRLDWDSIRDTLVEQFGEKITQYIFVVSRSSGGKGLSIAVAISPLDLDIPSSKNAKKVARLVLNKFAKALELVGAGVDYSALGLKRDFMNWRRDDNNLFCNLFLMYNEVQKKRTPVLKELLTHLSQFKELGDYEAKKGRTDLLHSDRRVESKLADFAISLWDAYLNNETVILTLAELREKFGLSQGFVYKWIKGGEIPWFRVENGEYGEYVFSFVEETDAKLIERAHKLANNQCDSKIVVGNLKSPEDVEDGEHNSWLTQLLLYFKHKGVSFDQALAACKLAISQTDAKDSSRNFRSVEKIAGNIFKRLPEHFDKGVKVSILWAERLLRTLSQNCREGVKPLREAPDSQACVAEEKMGKNVLEKGGVGALPLQKSSSQVETPIVLHPSEPEISAFGETDFESKAHQPVEGSRDLWDFLGSAIDRCLSRASEDDIYRMLAWVEDTLASAEWELRESLKAKMYENDSLKKFRRVLKYYLPLPTDQRRQVLEIFNT